VRQTPSEVSLVLEPGLARHIAEALGKFVQQLLAAGHPPVVLCSPQIRLGFRRFFESTYADLAVIAYPEIPPRTEIQNAATIPAVA
jgi:flagellar biosynthesis protein FlhA